MTSLGNLCMCGKLAKPGSYLCGPCLEDVRMARAAIAAEITQMTAEHEARVCSEDEVEAA